MKVGALLIIALLFAAYSHQPVNNQADNQQDSVPVSQDNSDEISEGHVVCPKTDASPLNRGCILTAVPLLTIGRYGLSRTMKVKST